MRRVCGYDFLVVVAMLGLLLPGCGESKLPVFPVEGKVFYQGDPATGALIVFHPKGQTKGKDDQVVPRPSAVVAEDGSFALTTHKPRDGARAGEYLISIVWFKNANNSEGSLGERNSEPRAGSKDFLNNKYSFPDRSGLTASIKPGVNTLPTFELE